MVNVSRYTVAEYLRCAAVVGITWPVPVGLDDVALERKLFTPPFTRRRRCDRSLTGRASPPSCANWA